ncbi:MAG: HlyD family efflux transporter periplasmic adaptor subunit [Clostridiales bacterium]|nr:HlyD family efflux transporter periplasmic adaptor subunit [Clostridiales bacterium]
MKRNRNVIKYRKPLKPNIALVILIIIILYVVVISWNYFHAEHISIYEVNETSIADDSTMTGFILRDESVVYSEQEGYINFYHADQSKVGKNEVIYTIDKNGTVNDLLEQVESSHQVTSSDILKLREVINDYYSNYNPANYYTIKDFHYNVENTIFEQSRDNLYSDIKKQLSEASKSTEIIKSKAATPGVISYSIDGYEDIKLERITSELFKDTASVDRTQLTSSEKVQASAPIYKLVTSDEWKIVIPLTDSIYKKIMDLSTVRVTVKKDQISFNCALSFQQNEGTNFAILTTSRYMGRYINDRYLDIELNLNAATGLKIPNSSIIKKKMTVVPKQYVSNGSEKPNSATQPGVVKVSYDKSGKEEKSFVSLENASLKEDKYYVNDTILPPGTTIVDPETTQLVTLSEQETLEGVYCVNTGYCQFRKIEKIYENNEYSIVSAETNGGISNYDHIVVNPERLNENDFIE